MARNNSLRFGASALLMACIAAFPAHAGQQSTTSSDNQNSASTKSTQASSAQASAAKAPRSKTSTRRKPNANAGGTSKSTGSAHHSTSASGHSTSRRKKTVKARGQQKIDSERAQKIQEALIREHYLTGDPTGQWNEATEAAMRRYQSDHGWQSKTVPDSRALIKLGLGPSNDRLLNPESAMTATSDAPSAAASAPGSQTSSPTSHSETRTTAPADPPAAGTSPVTPPSNDPAHPQ